jgi:hypothetical protein
MASTHVPIVVAAPSTDAWRKLDSIVTLTDHRGLVEGDPVLDLRHAIHSVSVLPC